MIISRSVVDRVRTQLDPPGRFLEKDPRTGLWHEVDDKRALEKTAQALRDGAAPLRKQQSEDMPDPPYLDAFFAASGKLPAATPPAVRFVDETTGAWWYNTGYSCLSFLPRSLREYRHRKVIEE